MLLGQRPPPLASQLDPTSVWTRTLRSVWPFEVLLASEVRRVAQRSLPIRNRGAVHCTVNLAAVVVHDAPVEARRPLPTTPTTIASMDSRFGCPT